MFKRILVPVDLSPKSAKTLATALRLGATNGARVTLLHVIEPIPHMEPRELRDFYATLEAKAIRWLKRMANQKSKKPTVNSKIVYGKRARTIVEFARKQRADLIVLRSHRVRPNAGFSSISYEVAVLAACPVLLIK